MKKILFIWMLLFVFSAYKEDKPAYKIYDIQGKESDYSQLLKKAKEADIVLFGENGGFRIWCLDYFNYCWEQWPGKPFIDQIVD